MNRARRHPILSRGMTIVEAAVATAIVGGVLVAAMNSVAASRTIRGRVADRARAQQLALDLMSEILQQNFTDPATPASSRTAWSYVSDYNGLVDSPPQTKSGTPIPDVAALSRTVNVQWADPNTFAPTTATNTGIYLITVTVSRGNLLLASLSAYRTSAWTTGTTPGTPSLLIASATASPTTGGGGRLTVNFSGTNSTDPSGNSLTYAWKFGDGSSATGATASHTYTAIGTYTATLTVSDGQGGVGIGAVTITVTK